MYGSVKHESLKKSHYYILHSLHTNYRRTHLVGEENIRSVSVNNHCHHELELSLFLFFQWTQQLLCEATNSYLISVTQS